MLLTVVLLHDKLEEFVDVLFLFGFRRVSFFRRTERDSFNVNATSEVFFFCLIFILHRQDIGKHTYFTVCELAHQMSTSSAALVLFSNSILIHSKKKKKKTGKTVGLRASIQITQAIDGFARFFCVCVKFVL